MFRFNVLFFGTVSPLEQMGSILADADASLSSVSPKSEEEFIEYGKEADGIIIHGTALVPRRVIDVLERCRIISKTGVGVDKIDLTAATGKGILVTNVPGVSIPEVSDQTMGLILALSRGIVRVWDLIRAGKWTQDGKREMLRLRGPVYRLQGKTLGIIGLGRIGRAVARKAQAFGMNILAFDPLVSVENASEIGVELTELDHLLETADFVTIHAPLIPETRGLLSGERLARMKPTAYLINAARGPIVDTEALYRLLADKKIAGAGLDVTDPEPLPTDSPFFNLENVIITGHTAANSEESITGVCLQAARDVAAFFKGEVPSSVVNPEALRH